MADNDPVEPASQGGEAPALSPAEAARAALAAAQARRAMLEAKEARARRLAESAAEARPEAAEPPPGGPADEPLPADFWSRTEPAPEPEAAAPEPTRTPAPPPKRPPPKGPGSDRHPKPDAAGKRPASDRHPKPAPKSDRHPKPTPPPVSRPSERAPVVSRPSERAPAVGRPSERVPAAPKGKPAARPGPGLPARPQPRPTPKGLPAALPARPAGASGKPGAAVVPKVGARAAPAPGGSTKKRLQSFADLGWKVTDPQEPTSLKVVAVDLGTEGTVVTGFEGSFNRPKDLALPTMVVVTDAHAFRSLERDSLELGLKAWEKWPSERVLRGTNGTLRVASQIGLVDFPADHVLSGLLKRIRDDRRKSPKELVLTLPFFLPSDRDEAIRAQVAPNKKGAFRGVPGPIAAAYFYVAPGLDSLASKEALPAWSREALESGRMLLLDWGATGLQYALVTVRPGLEDVPTELRLVVAGTWPSLGGHRLTLSIVNDLKELLAEKIVAAGPSDGLLLRALIATGEKLHDRVPQPPGYEEAFRRLRLLGSGPLLSHEEDERRRLRNIIFPTAWRFARGEEPAGYAPYRKLAVRHFKHLWDEAERIKRMAFSDPTKYRQRGSIPWNLEQLDSPFCSHLDEEQVAYPVERFLSRLERSLAQCLAHVDRRLSARMLRAPVHVAFSGMQACSPILPAAVEAHGARQDARALSRPSVAPVSSDPLEMRALVNRGASLLNRDKRRLDFGPAMDVLPFSIQIADCLGNIPIFSAGVIDELSVFQRRFRVEGGHPHLEFLIYESEDGTRRGSWGAVDFSKPFEFGERDRVFAVDPRYGFGGELPKLVDLKGDKGAELAAKYFDRGTANHQDGLINFRAYAPREGEEARRLLHFLEYGLQSEFHRKVYLLEREFAPPPRRFDFIYQRYYLSRAQELIVVREWWAPWEGDRLMRHKTLHTCQGTTTADAILGLEWGVV